MPPLIIAHRGDSAHVPENTLAAFAAALEEGADLVEFDVQLTKDGQVVVIHDATVDRTTTGRGRVRDLTLAEIRVLSAGYPSRFADTHRGERVPSLGEALAMLKDRARVMVEKHMLWAELRGRAREAGLKLATWVVDDPEELRRLARFDLYGVASNRPGVMLDAIREEE